MSAFKNLWPKFREKKYREEIVAQFSLQAIPAQIAALMKQRGLTQTQLAERSGLTQGVISRAADPSYGKLTLRTIVRVAAGFDVAFVPLFVPFRDLPKWFSHLYEEPFAVASFDEDDVSASTFARLAKEYIGAQWTGNVVEPLLKPPVTERQTSSDVAELAPPPHHENYGGSSLPKDAGVVDFAQAKAKRDASTLVDVESQRKMIARSGTADAKER